MDWAAKWASVVLLQRFRAYMPGKVIEQNKYRAIGSVFSYL